MKRVYVKITEDDVYAGLLHGPARPVDLDELLVQMAKNDPKFAFSPSTTAALRNATDATRFALERLETKGIIEIHRRARGGLKHLYEIRKDHIK